MPLSSGPRRIRGARVAETSVTRGPAPRSEGELLDRVRALEGRTLGEIAAVLGVELGTEGRRTKGKIGELLERALGAESGSLAEVDFPHLGIELKSIPVSEKGAPRESTYVCALSLPGVDRAEWQTSWVRRKLACVLWVPVVSAQGRGGGQSAPLEIASRRLGTSVLWRPTPAQEAILAADFDEIVGHIGAGHLESITARTGRWLQLRPKARDSHARTLAFGPGDERTLSPPKGFYLRARFTGALLKDPTAVPPPR